MDLKNLHITVFDIHTTIYPHLSESSSKGYNELFMFLDDATKYNEHFNSLERVGTENFEFMRMSKKEREKSDFWEQYIQFSNKSVWEMQLPFVGYLKKDILASNMQYSFLITPNLKIYLSPLGWSTKISFELEGDIKKYELIEIMAKLTGKTANNNNLPLKIRGEAKSLKDVFIMCQTLLFREVYNVDSPPTSKNENSKAFLCMYK